PTVFGMVGAVMAPFAGALAADYARDRGYWGGSCRAVDLAGLFAWIAGTGVGLLPYLGPTLGAPALARVQPAAVLAFATAFLVRVALTIFRKAPTDPSSTTDGGSPPQHAP